mmetsp:Transcript_8187/g.11605  ORF Transcript_8187/g.11605 Transcript_8187/m.11605 type:complete len:254 (+) Transcript_8187:230-991(+)|eukprot:CAMPEP_0184489088 /NCGR_PEP_ID=MMETSP0113_2-20130426/14362_1 /TAXON_ID=91329 /ORGANISM="Norrisiella sphaerica, Strain BC52" /LENGTH=253 /DNA_ID=CAMNT_0026872301 /DNA_START=223 /DNA_END=984 /DNA_ORIENTATION=-
MGSSLSPSLPKQMMPDHDPSTLMKSLQPMFDFHVAGFHENGQKPPKGLFGNIRSRRMLREAMRDLVKFVGIGKSRFTNEEEFIEFALRYGKMFKMWIPQVVEQCIQAALGSFTELLTDLMKEGHDIHKFLAEIWIGVARSTWRTTEEFFIEQQTRKQCRRIWRFLDSDGRGKISTGMLTRKGPSILIMVFDKKSLRKKLQRTISIELDNLAHKCNAKMNPRVTDTLLSEPMSDSRSPIAKNEKLEYPDYKSNE